MAKRRPHRVQTGDTFFWPMRSSGSETRGWPVAPLSVFYTTPTPLYSWSPLTSQGCAPSDIPRPPEPLGHLVITDWVQGTVTQGHSSDISAPTPKQTGSRQPIHLCRGQLEATADWHFKSAVLERKAEKNDTFETAGNVFPLQKRSFRTTILCVSQRFSVLEMLCCTCAHMMLHRPGPQCKRSLRLLTARLQTCY